MEQGKNEEAVDYLAKAIRIYPAYVEAWYNYGPAEMRLGRIIEARSRLKEAYRLSPQNQSVRQSLEYVQKAIDFQNRDAVIAR
jgi:tetratricopeptide (TPR) repeat protein